MDVSGLWPDADEDRNWFLAQALVAQQYADMYMIRKAGYVGWRIVIYFQGYPLTEPKHLFPGTNARPPSPV